MTKSTTSSKTVFWILAVILLILGVISVAVWDRLPAQDPDSYFNFADQKIVFGIPHFFDVTSNILFLYISVFALIAGFRRIRMIPPRIFLPFVVFNVMVFFTGWGSSFFHFMPTPQNLFWDRLPLAMVFASLLTMILTDRVFHSFYKVLLVVLNAAAFWTVWNINFGNHDIRPYLLLQFGTLLMSLFLLMSTKKNRLHENYLWAALLLYFVGKICELYDHQIYDTTTMLVSGHTLKHALAAVAVLMINISVLSERRRKYA